jgi:hypothetical protein
MDVGLLFCPVLDQPPSPEPAAAPPAGEVSPASEPEVEEPSEDRSWWSRFLHTRGHHVSESDDASPPELNGHEPIAPVSRSVTLTEEELNERINRQAQSLHDREVARRNREAQEAERKRLRDDDPFAYVQKERDDEDAAKLRAEQTGQLMTLLGHVGRQHDAVSLDPIVNVLPVKERERILALPNAGQGLPGRKVIVDEALKTYGRLEYERGFREAQTKLRKDPAFRKSVMSELRGGYEEPELYPGNGSPAEGLDDGNVSNILRRQYFQR